MMMKSKIKFYLGFFFFVVNIWCLAVFSQADNVLKIKYLEKLPHGVQLDEKFSNQSKYLIYKYIGFEFAEPMSLKSANLKLLVDKKWYTKNNVKDIIFLNYLNNSWSRVQYDTKVNKDNYYEYSLNLDNLGKYLVIIGVLSLDKPDYINKDKIKVDNIDSGALALLRDKLSVGKMIDFGDTMILKLKEPVKIKGASTVANTIATASLLGLLISVGGVQSLLLLLWQMGASLLGIFSAEKKYDGGVVYDINTGKPISLVRVDLIDKKTNKIQTTKFTNSKGEYYFLVPEGEYRLEARKKGYMIVKEDGEKLLNAFVDRGIMKTDIDMKESGVIRSNIAMIRENKKVFISNAFQRIIVRLWRYFAGGLFFIGFLFNVWLVFVDFNWKNVVILSIYLLIIWFRFVFTGKTKYGIILNESKQPEAFAIIRILDLKTKRLVARALSDTKGRYYLVLSPGEYLLKIRTVKGKTLTRRLRVLDKGALKQKIVIK